MCSYEFSTRNTEDTLATMVEDAYVNHIPVLDRRRGPGRVARVLFETVHSADAAGYGNDASLANDRRRPAGGRNGFQVHSHDLDGLDVAGRSLPRESAWKFR